MNENLSEKAKADLKLVLLARDNGNQDAYAQLMDRYTNSVRFMISKIVRDKEDAEDLTIEVFAKAFMNISKYNPEYAFSTWLFRISTNHAIDFVRKKRLQTTSIDSKYKSGDGDEMTFDVRDAGLDPSQHAIRKQKIELIRMVVTNLPKKYQALVKLRYFKEYTYEEVADELDLPLGTVKAQLFRARDILYKMIREWKDKM